MDLRQLALLIARHRLTHGGLRQDRLLARHLGNAHHFILLVPHLRNLPRSLPLTPNLANPTGRANVRNFSGQGGKTPCLNIASSVIPPRGR
jgi:hypothetical protein